MAKATLKEFIELWQRLDCKGKEEAWKYMMSLYGKDLPAWLLFINSGVEIGK